MPFQWDIFFKLAASYLEKRLAEVDALGDEVSPAMLRERWNREFTRDDAPEAILLRSVDNATTTQQVRGGLFKVIQGYGGPAK